MKDQLKEHIEKNRQDFEIYTQDYETIWNDISWQLDNKRPFRSQHYRIYLRIAASILILITVGFAFYMGKRSAEINKNGISLHNVSPEMAETEAYYSALINDKMEIIKSQDPELDPDFWTSIKQLDQDYAQLKKDLQDKADSEKVIDAMINYYRLKLEMLERISEELKEKANDNEDINI